MKLKTTLLAGLLTAANAAIISQYTFDNPTGSATNPASSIVAGGTSSSDFGVGAGFTGTAQTVEYAFVSQSLGLELGVGSDLADAISTNEYFTFSMTINEGVTADLTNLTLDVARSTNGAQDFYVFSSITGFTTADVLDSATGVATTGSSIDVDLSGSEFQGLTNETVEFRVYVDNRYFNANGGSGTYVDNVTLNGTVAVPEPSSLALLGLGALTITARRKRS